MNYGGAPIAHLEQGDTIVLMTDGVIEAECIDGGPFGEQRAIDTVRANSHKSAAEIVKSIRNELFAQCQTTQDDDITVVVIKVLRKRENSANASIDRSLQATPPTHHRQNQLGF